MFLCVVITFPAGKGAGRGEEARPAAIAFS